MKLLSVSTLLVKYIQKLSVTLCGSEVKFNLLSDKEIEEYVKTGKPMDKAGSYGIQDGALVESVNGSVYNVIGLPIEKIQPILDIVL